MIVSIGKDGVLGAKIKSTVGVYELDEASLRLKVVILSIFGRAVERDRWVLLNYNI